MSGYLITFEGIDGCGKSTQLEKARSLLVEREIPHTVTREPGGTTIGENIRSIILSPGSREMTPGCEVLLYCAARAQIVTQLITPALQRGEIVLCDRFEDATFAYQGWGRHIPMDELESVNRFATGGVIPALTLLFDVSASIAEHRRGKKSGTTDRLEANARDFFERVRNGYRDLAQRNPHRIKLLNGEETIESVSLKVRETITSFLNDHYSTGNTLRAETTTAF